ncbi:MAG: Tab2/Atab2 family RNA-binding protein, partial [Prochloraceae cyanobacterium]
MRIWQADFYRRPLQEEQELTFWELLICAPNDNFIYAAKCPQAQANAD